MAPKSTPSEEPVGGMRLLPSVNFGGRAAALARTALPLAVLAMTVTGTSAQAATSIEYGAPNPVVAAPAGTTCC